MNRSLSVNPIQNTVRIDERFPITFMVGHLRLFGMFHLPFTEGPVPAVLICSGLNGDKVGRNRAYVTIAGMLAQRGIASFRFDYRGCGDSEGEFSQVTVDTQVEDALAAFQMVKNHPRINSQRLGIIGRSFGGLIAVQSAAKLEAFRSICLWAPVFNGEPWATLWKLGNEGKLTPQEYEEVMSVNGHMANIDLWLQLFQTDTTSAMQKLSEIPLLHIHGEKDSRVDVSHAEMFAQTRKTSDAVSNFIRLPESDHEFNNRWEREEALEATVEWFRQTL